MTFAQWLQSQLDERGWNLADLARHTGIRYPTIYSYANGSRVPDKRPASQENLDAIASALGVPAATVRDAAGLVDPNRSEEERAQLKWAALGRDLSEEDRRTAEALLRAFRAGRGYKS